MQTFADQVIEIQNLKARYCGAADLSADDPAEARRLFAEIFADDFVGDYGFDPLIGPEAITSFLCTSIAANSEWMIHMLHSPRIEINGDQATGDWTVMAYMKRRDGSEDRVLGRYSDVFRRTPGGWRIARVAFGRLV